MPLETADDLDVFFDPEDFGESAVYSFAGMSMPVVVIRNQDTIDLKLGGTTVPSASLLFQIRADIVTPETDALLRFVDMNDVPTGEICRIIGEPRLDSRGAVWNCEAEPA